MEPQALFVHWLDRQPKTFIVMYSDHTWDMFTLPGWNDPDRPDPWTIKKDLNLRVLTQKHKTKLETRNYICNKVPRIKINGG